MDIKLSVLSFDDLDLVRYWRTSPEVSQYMYTSKEISLDDQKKWYDRVQCDKTCIYWVVEYGGNKIGLASLTGISETFNSCYWAFYLSPDIPKGGGVGSKIEFNVIEYVFNELKLNKLRCEVMDFNDKVISLHEKFGFRREAYYRQHVKKEGKLIDVVGLALLKDEWKSIREMMKAKIYRIN